MNWSICIFALVLCGAGWYQHNINNDVRAALLASDAVDTTLYANHEVEINQLEHFRSDAVRVLQEVKKWMDDSSQKANGQSADIDQVRERVESLNRKFDELCDDLSSGRELKTLAVRMALKERTPPTKEMERRLRELQRMRDEYFEKQNQTTPHPTKVEDP